MPNTVEFEIVQEPPVPSVYANASRVVVGVYDFRVVFSEMMPPQVLPQATGVLKTIPKVLQVDRVSVVMSPQHMKKFIASVMPRIEEYERNFGPIPEEQPHSE